jgi:hypothetical protein
MTLPMARPREQHAAAKIGFFSFMFSDEENVSGAGGRKRILVG